MKPRIITEGPHFPEGPSYLGNGAVTVVEREGESLTRVDPDSTCAVLGDCGGGPNASVRGAHGEIDVANNGGLSMAGNGYWHALRRFDGCVQRVDADGTLYVTHSAN